LRCKAGKESGKEMLITSHELMNVFVYRTAAKCQRLGPGCGGGFRIPV
jgi:hypothetical protein